MTRSRAFFLEEAQECLARLRHELEPGEARTEVQAHHRAARVIRGGAHLVGYRDLMRIAAGLEELFRESMERGEWTAEERDRARTGVAELAAAVAAVEAGEVEPDMELYMESETRTEAQVVALEDLEYTGREALERAAELRGPLEDAIVADDPAGPIMDELFDLIRLGMR